MRITLAPACHTTGCSVVYALVLALLSRAAVATPVRATQSTPHDHAHCVTYARGLLSNLKLVLDKTECLQNIANDLSYHQSMLTEYVSNQMLNSESIKELNSITNSILNLQQGLKHWGADAQILPPCFRIRPLKPHPTLHTAISNTFLTTATGTFRTLNFEPWPGFEPATSQPSGKALPIEPQDHLQEPDL
ncbi:hypothetical protein C0J50_14053 [Silurus asotus]|uniref:Interleukin-4 n=1 Tax=Silurus asotus TaxID=30991 RepID=A0AAD5B1X6_SILAS|nr:hypothetical protein C0J50_14053 [Silurus asotus]